MARPASNFSRSIDFVAAAALLAKPAGIFLPPIRNNSITFKSCFVTPLFFAICLSSWPCQLGLRPLKLAHHSGFLSSRRNTEPDDRVVMEFCKLFHGRNGRVEQITVRWTFVRGTSRATAFGGACPDQRSRLLSGPGRGGCGF